METAYIEVYDCRNFDNVPLSDGVTRKVLSGAQTGQATGGVTVIPVQFNPSSLRFSSGSKGNGKEKSDITHNEKGQTHSAEAENASALVQVGIKLIFDITVFDDTIYDDCYGVQRSVDRFIAIVENPYVRQVTFYWGTMCYSGVVKSVDAEYVLFNENGVPMRAVIDFSIDVT